MPKYSKKEVERAGKLLASCDTPDADRERAMRVLEYWRAAFQEPMDEMFLALRRLVQPFPDAIVFGRIKRTPAILEKLRRDGNRFSLRTMDDIAGCRIVVPSVKQLHDVVGTMRSTSLPMLCKSEARDYVDHPKKDGYRSVHFITAHKSPLYGYSKLHCETQVRTKLQHAWSTALETYGVISGSGIKAGGGTDGERQLFACISGLFALEETCAFVPSVSTDRAGLIGEIRELESRCKVVERLRAASRSVSIVPMNAGIEQDAYCLLDIDYAEQSTKIFAYAPAEREQAQEDYVEKERQRRMDVGGSSLRDVLLVRVASAGALTAGYPNYTTDIAFFLDEYTRLVEAD